MYLPASVNSSDKIDRFEQDKIGFEMGENKK